MTVVLDGSVCFDRFGACFQYYSQMAPRLVAQGHSVTLTPSPTDALSELKTGGAQVAQTVVPSAAWLPAGRFRSLLSAWKRQFEDRRWTRRLAAGEKPIFQSFYYGLPPSQDFHLLGMVLDLIPERFAQEHRGPAFDALRRRKAECISRATRLLAISTKTRDDLHALFDIPLDRIDVVPLAIDPAPFRAGDKPTPAERPFFLQVGGRQRHKNFERLLKAFALFSQRDSMDLVCAGEEWEPEERDQIRRLGLSARVRLVHRPTTAQLIGLYRTAEALVYPSLYEGFGLPPLEAMAAGTPVAASWGGSIPEVVGEAARLFDPQAVESIADALEAMREPRVLQALREAGERRVALFNWDRTADATAAVYRHILECSERASTATIEMRRPIQTA